MGFLVEDLMMLIAIGVLLVGIPFMVLGYIMVQQLGWKEFLLIWGLYVAVVTCIIAGVTLIAYAVNA